VRDDPAFDAAWTLFCTLHDSPSPERAEELIRWLAVDPGNICALDDVLTLWALTGAALIKPSMDEALREEGRLQ
jgi:ferric-dicitrate binding protein FerR (iron transport regulator)